MSLPNLAEQSDNLSQLDLLYRVQNLITAYVIKNMLLVGKADQAQVETYINPNLYQIAVKYYNDAELWSVIANANNIQDPFPIGTFTLLIPPKPPLSTGGILNP